MINLARAALCVVCVCSAATLSTRAQQGGPSPSVVDFGRDVQPIFRQHCIGCHGPSQQMNGFRLDRRSAAMKGGTIAQIGPGNSEGSRLYLRLVGDAYGPQMPPTGALKPEQIAVIKAWIDQGAVWPDELAGEAPTRPDGGATPLMFAALNDDTGAVRRLLDSGADPNVKSDAGGTALMWALPNLEIMRLLADRGADVNARSADNRTPLMIAAAQPGTLPAVAFLLDRGADPSVTAFDGMNALAEAAYAGDPSVFGRLVEAGADLTSVPPWTLGLAVRNCRACIEPLVGAMDRARLTLATVLLGPPASDAVEIGTFVARGADPHATDQEGRTLLMLAASSDALPLETVRALLARGVDVNARSKRGDTALGLARLRGDTPLVEALRKAGAKDDRPEAAHPPSPKPAASARAAVLRSLPLLQRNDVTFLRKSGCVSCHNNTLTAMTVAAARQHGFTVDEEAARDQVNRIATYLEGWRERALQGIGIPGDSDTISYILLGLAAERHPADRATDAMARYLKRRQLADGSWRMIGHRPPIESNDIELTAASMRAMQHYAPNARRAEYDAAAARAGAWLESARPRTTEEHAFRLLGLAWSDAPRAAIEQAARDLVAQQRADGGWSQLPSLGSDAYATGQALVALHESGTAGGAADDRGVQFLIGTQLEDGSWFVRSRALPIQPFFESGFPHGRDQFISAAATNWATMALAYRSR